jgi:hypothetical protein
VIYVSDGYSNDLEGSGPAFNNAQLLKNNAVANATIITVGLSDNPNQSELRNIASPSSPVITMNSGNSFTDAANQVLAALCP